MCCWVLFQLVHGLLMLLAARAAGAAPAVSDG